MVRLFLLRLLESYFRHRWLYLLPLLIMTVVAGLSAALTKPRYGSTGVMYVQNESLVSSLNNLPLVENGSWWLTPADLVVNEITDLLQTEAFIRPLVANTPLTADLGSGTSEEVAAVILAVNENIYLESVGDNLVRFSIYSEDPQVAYQLANQVTEIYILWKLNSSRQDSIAAQGFFQTLLEPYQQELEQARENLDDYLATNPAPVRGNRPEIEELEIARLQEQVGLAQNRVLVLIEKEESAQLAQIQAERNLRQTYLIIDAPKVPVKPLTGLRALVLDNIIFLIVGGMLSIIGIIGGAVLDRSLRFPIDAYQWLHLPILAMTPQNQISTRQVREIERRVDVAPISVQSDSMAPSALPGTPVTSTQD
jgi:hypothetical protein